MLRIVQFIALSQGLFLLIALLKNRKDYLKPAFYLLIGTIISVVLYIFGDDDTNIINHRVDIFLFDKSLFISFLFLFVKYYLSKAKRFNKWDYLYFIPNILFFVIEFLEIIFHEGILYLDIPEIALELTFLVYMIYTIVNILKVKSQTWMLLFIVPLLIIIGLSIIDEILYWFHIDNINILKTHEHLGKYTIVVVAFLFYTIALKLILEPKDILIKNEDSKYKTSTLDKEQMSNLEFRIIKLMQEKKLYKDPSLSVQKIAEELQTSRQYVSEVLNIKMKTNFHDFVNSYRVEAFIECLKNKNYENYTLLGIAKTVGFNSKTSFYSAFKKIKKQTPLEFKKQFDS